MLNKKLNESKVSADKDRADVIKRHKAEVKILRKDLGEERKKKVKLEKSLKIKSTMNMHQTR